MLLAKLGHRFFFLMMMVAPILGADEQELLQTKDINRVMKQIFDQHVDKKEMTTSILKNSFKVYIDQFDPDRMYLLESEVNPYLKMSDQQLARFMSQYQQNQFPEFQDLNQIIQKAILRSRQLREPIEKNQISELFQQSKKISADGYEEWRDPDLKRSFPRDEKELQEQIRHQLVQLFASERKRYGDEYVQNREIQTGRIFEKQARSHESQYLFVTENGEAMNEAEKQNAFVLHVLKALANSLDAHTTVLNPTEAYDMRVRLEKEIEGIGIVVRPSANGVFVVSQLIEGGPAAKSKQIKISDELIEIDGKAIRGEQLSKVIEMIRGKPGSNITLVLHRTVDETGNPMDLTFTVPLVREDITVNEDRAQSSFETFGNGIIGKIKLDSFYQGENGVSSENDVREAIRKLQRQGNLKGLILDLRENSGGFLSQAVKVVSLFITNGVVVISKYFSGEEHVYRDVDGKVAFDGPMIILTSKATASAAEIVAQALQDYGVAIVVGDEHTYGKGTIQSQTVTEHTGSTFFKVTVGKYYTVSGKTPQIQGVKADIVAPSPFVHENIGEEYLDSALKQDTISPEYKDDLADITPNLKPWYLHYYVPTIQHKEETWDSMIPKLKKNSEYRIANNKDYQVLIKGKNSNDTATKFRQAEDIQMTEAVNIMKDMITFHQQER